MTRELARFRVNPARVRVSIRTMRMSAERVFYRVTIRERKDNGIEVYATGESAELATARAIAIAQKAHMPGIDPGMEWAYPHPFGADHA